MLAGFALASLYTSARVGLEPRDPSNGVAVMFAPWTSANAALARAVEPDARFVRFGGFPFVVIVMPEGPGYVRRIKSAGAWLVADPSTLAACLSVFSTAQAKQ
jgi:hypothetical protein